MESITTIARAAVRVAEDCLIERSKAESRAARQLPAGASQCRILSPDFVAAIVARPACEDVNECARDLQDLAALHRASAMLAAKYRPGETTSWFEEHADCPKCCLFADGPCAAPYAAYNTAGSNRQHAIAAVRSGSNRNESVGRSNGVEESCFAPVPAPPSVSVLVGDAVAYGEATTPQELTEPPPGDKDQAPERDTALFASAPSNGLEAWSWMLPQRTTAAKTSMALVTALSQCVNEHGRAIYHKDNAENAFARNAEALYQQTVQAAHRRVDDQTERLVQSLHADLQGSISGASVSTSKTGPEVLAAEAPGSDPAAAASRSPPKPRALPGPNPKSESTAEAGLARLLDAAAAWRDIAADVRARRGGGAAAEAGRACVWKSKLARVAAGGEALDAEAAVDMGIEAAGRTLGYASAVLTATRRD